MVDVRSIDLFYAGLDQGIVPDLDGKGKRFAFPIPVRIISRDVPYIGCPTAYIAPAAVEMIGRILWRVFVVPQKGKCVSLMTLIIRKSLA